MILNKLTFLIDSTGNFINTYRPNIKSRTSHINIIQVVAPVSPSVNIVVSYDQPHVAKEPLTEFMAITNLKGKDVLDTTNPDFNNCAEWNVWELTMGEKANNLILANRPTKLNVTFSFIDYNIIGDYQNIVEFGINKADIPATYLPDTLYINRVPNFYSTLLGKKLFEGQAFVANDNRDGYIDVSVGETLFITAPASITVEPAFRGDIPAAVVPEGIDFNNIMDNHEGRIANLEGRVDNLEAGGGGGTTKPSDIPLSDEDDEPDPTKNNIWFAIT